MATNIGSLAVQITGNASGLSVEIKKAEKELSSFASRVGSGAVGAFQSVAGTIGGIFDKITGALSSPGALIGGALAGFGLSALVVESVQLASEVEDTQASFRVMLGDAEKAKKLFADIRKLAGETPLTSGGLTNLAQTLVGAGVSAEQVVPTLRVLGDLAQGDEERLKGLAMAYTQVRAKGKLATEELNQFAERQVPLRPALANVMGVSEAALGDLIERGKVGFPDLQRAMVNMTSEGGRFFGLMEQRSKTFSGLMSSLKDNIQVVGANFGQAVIEEFNLKPAIDQLSRLVSFGDEGVDKLRPFLRDVRKLAVSAGEAFFDFAKGGAIAFANFVNQVRDLTGGMAEIINDINYGMHWLAGTSSQFKPIKIDLEVGRFDPAKIAAMFDEAARRARGGISLGGVSDDGLTAKQIAQRQAQWSADRLGMMAGLAANAGGGGSLFGDAIVRMISTGLPNAAYEAGVDVGKAVGNGIKDGLKIEARTLNADQIKFQQGLMDRLNPSQVFQRRIADLNAQNAISPMGPAFGQGVREAWNDLAASMRASGQQFAAAMEKGGVDAYSIGARAQFGGGQQDAKQIWRDMLEQEKKQAAANEKLVNELRRAKILVEKR